MVTTTYATLLITLGHIPFTVLTHVHIAVDQINASSFEGARKGNSGAPPAEPRIQLDATRGKVISGFECRSINDMCQEMINDWVGRGWKGNCVAVRS